MLQYDSHSTTKRGYRKKLTENQNKDSKLKLTIPTQSSIYVKEELLKQGPICLPILLLHEPTAWDYLGK